MKFAADKVKHITYSESGITVSLKNGQEFPLNSGDVPTIVLPAPERPVDRFCKTCCKPMVKGDKKAWPPHFCSSDCHSADMQERSDEKARSYYIGLGNFIAYEGINFDVHEILFSEVVGVSYVPGGGMRVLLRNDKWIGLTFDGSKQFWEKYNVWRDCIRPGGVFTKEYARMCGRSSNVCAASGSVQSPIEKLIAQILSTT